MRPAIPPDGQTAVPTRQQSVSPSESPERGAEAPFLYTHVEESSLLVRPHRGRNWVA